jgi:hypothetical protein
VVAKQVLLTAAHCDRPALWVEGTELVILRKEKDSGDHMLLRVQREFKYVARLGPAVEQGDQVFVWGNPERLGLLLRLGHYVGDTLSSGKAVQLYDLSASFGDSGAAIYDKRGRLVGVVSLIYQRTAHLHLMGAFPLDFTKEQWDAVGS